MGARAMLRCCALGLALLASAAPYGLSAAAAAAAAPASPMHIRVGQSNDFTRIEFHWQGNVGYTTRREGDDVIVRFSRDADPDMARLRVDPPPFLKTAVLRRQGKTMEVVLTLKPGADAKAGQDTDAIYVNLFPKPADTPQAPPAPKVDPVPAGGVVRMQGEIAQGQVLLRFPWKAPLGAAAFRRGEAVWLVFDTQAKLDVSKAPAETSMFKGLKVYDGAGYSAVRIASPSVATVKAWADGSTWVLALGPGVQPPAVPIKAERDVESPTPGLRAALAGATRSLWLDDPLVGDRIAVVTALPPSKGVPGRRSYVDFALLPSAQGMALEPAVADLTVAVDGEWVHIGRPKGLDISTVVAAAGSKVKASAEAALGLPQPAVMPGLVDYVGWSRTGESGFAARYSQLQNAAADEAGREAAGDRTAGLNARMGLARFLVGSELGYEAIGVLNMLHKRHEELAGDPEFRGLRGAANAQVGRYKEAENDFSVPVLANDPASSLWRGYVASKENDWQASADAFAKGLPALNQFTPAWQSRFARAYAESALELGKLNVAFTEVALSIAQTKDPVEQLRTRLIQARLIEAMGYPQRALPLYQAVARAPLDQISAPAQMHVAELRLKLGQISQTQAISQLDALRFRWRGDRVELELIRNLGRLYLQGGHYREALETLKSMANAPTQAPEMIDINSDLRTTFRALFLDGRADGMEPIQALALFYDFTDLTPVGADGDLMVRKLARRLVDVDLLDKAAELLKYQVDKRLDGIAKAQVATDLATLYIMDRKPEQAIEALNSSRTSILPKEMQDQRRMIEARAWLDLNQNDHALELVAKDTSPDADGVRAEVAWRMQNWGQAGGLLEKILGDRWKKPDPLAPEQEAMLLRAGIAYSRAADDAGLTRLRTRFGAFVDQAKSADALRVALAGAASMPTLTRDFAKAAAETDIFAGWVERMKQRFKDAPSVSSNRLAAIGSGPG